MTGESRLRSSWPEVSVVIPTLNEARNLPHVFERLPAGIAELIVVDGHSVDNTLGVARQLRPDAHLVVQTRRGKGNALACGFVAATKDIIAMIDADGSTDPQEIPRFVSALVDGADFAKGSRFMAGGGSRDITRLRSLGNRMLSGLVNTLYGTAYTDLCYGFNAFWRRHLPVLGLDAPAPQPLGGSGQLWGDGFEVETLINIRVAAAGLAVAEVPSFEHSRIYGVSNLSAFSDGMRVLHTIVRERAPTRRAVLTPPAHGKLWPVPGLQANVVVGRKGPRPGGATGTATASRNPRRTPSQPRNAMRPTARQGQIQNHSDPESPVTAGTP